jgi:hypothetical protein
MLYEAEFTHTLLLLMMTSSALEFAHTPVHIAPIQLGL